MKVYDLEAEPLRIARQAECEKARRIYGDAFLNSSAPYRVRIHVARTTIQDYLDGKLPYSAAVVAHLRQNFPDHGI